MSLIELEQLSTEQLAVIEYLYDLSSRPHNYLPVEDRALLGLSQFLMYLSASAAHEPAMLSGLPGRSVGDAIRIYKTEDVLLSHVLDAVMQKVLFDDENTPETNPYTTPLAWPPATEGEDPSYMSRFDLYMHLHDFLSFGIEGVHYKIKRTIRGFVRRHLQSAIRKHYARRRKPRGQKT